MNIASPLNRAAVQSQPGSSANWDETFRRIMALTATDPSKFASQPKANRFSAILEAVVPNRTDPTHEKVLAIVNGLVQCKAVRLDEGGELYNALLQRVSRYNSNNVQTNLDRLVSDVREAVSLKERTKQAPSLASIISLNAFLSSLPAVVPKGESDYLAFISALKILVSEVPQTDVYKSGPNYYFSTIRNGTQTVNLTSAFENLYPIWGVQAPINSKTSVSSILSPNTRLLLLLVAPFTEPGLISPGSYIGYLLTLYRETLSNTRANEETYNEITSVSRAIGEEGTQNLQSTLNFLLTNKQKRIPKVYSLSKNEEKILRYIQQSVSLYMMQEGLTPSAALDMTSANLAPSFYASNMQFINKLMDYLHRAAALSPEYFTNAILNAAWIPPEGFYTGDFDFPDNDSLAWDLTASNEYVDKDLRNSIQSIPEETGEASASANTYMNEFENLFPSKSNNKNENSEVEKLTEQLSRWKTYAQEMAESQLSGEGNPFKHLQPKGLKYY